MQRKAIYRLSLSAAVAMVALLSGLAAPDAAAAGTCYCTIPYTLQISGTGGSCSQAQASFNVYANLYADAFCNLLSRPSSVCDGPNTDSQGPCFWDTNVGKWRIDGFVSGHCLFCPGGPKIPPAP